jgi:hypothetical protein
MLVTDGLAFYLPYQWQEATKVVCNLGASLLECTVLELETTILQVGGRDPGHLFARRSAGAVRECTACTSTVHCTIYDYCRTVHTVFLG